MGFDQPQYFYSQLNQPIFEKYDPSGIKKNSFAFDTDTNVLSANYSAYGSMPKKNKPN